GAAKVNDIGVARRRDHKIVVPALALAVVVRRVVRIRAIRARFKGELRRTVLHPVAPEKLTRRRSGNRVAVCVEQLAHSTIANVHASMAAVERNGELRPIGVFSRGSWREDLCPTPAAIGRAPDTLLKSRRVEGVVT